MGTLTHLCQYSISKAFLTFSGAIEIEQSDKIGATCLCLNPDLLSKKLFQELKRLNWIVVRKNPAGIYLLKVNNRNTRTRCEICSKLTIKISSNESNCILKDMNFDDIEAVN